MQRFAILSSLAKILEDVYDTAEDHLNMPTSKKELSVLTAFRACYLISSLAYEEGFEMNLLANVRQFLARIVAAESPRCRRRLES
jgi:hypothetical protein